MTGLIGGGSGMPHPGEASLAHRGVLFLDEFGEFRHEVLQSLRQPLEDGFVTIVRSKWAVTYPARFQLVAASNPCPCGHRGDDIKPCVCLEHRLASYRERLSGPVIDRIDLQVEVTRVARSDLFGLPQGDPSAAVSARVAAARERQRARLGPSRLSCNAELPPRDLDKVCGLSRVARARVEEAVDKMGLTARGAHRVIRVSRTIADLAGDDGVEAVHVDEALNYRVLDKRA